MNEPEPASLLLSHAAPQSPSFSFTRRRSAFTTCTSGTMDRKMADGSVRVNSTVWSSTARVLPGAIMRENRAAAPCLRARMRSIE